MIEYQQTLGNKVTISGIGLHSGVEVNLAIIPAKQNKGISFKRVDVINTPSIPASCEYVVDTARGTTIGRQGTTVSTIEHLMAALAGLGIDNAVIEIDGPEVPILDGSAAPFIKAIANIGLETQKAPRNYLEVTAPISFIDEHKSAVYELLPADDFEVRIEVDYNSPFLGVQKAELLKMAHFKVEIAACRTFCFLHELEQLLAHGLIKGGDLDNAIVIVDRDISDEELGRLSKIFDKPQVKVEKEGVLINIKLKFENEPARHKLLDVVGDLYLLGQPIKGKLTASKPGHESNVKFAKKIRSMMVKTKPVAEAPFYDPNAEPALDINVIKGFLPHKYPFLLVDKVMELNETKVLGIKNITINEQLFQGHFPDEPVFPGVLIIEAMAQCGGILVMNSIPDPENYTTYFLKIDKAKFKRKVVPGDTLMLDMHLIGPIRRGICEMKGFAWVGNKLAAEAELVAQIARKPEEG